MENIVAIISSAVYVQVSHMLLILKNCYKMYVFRVNTVSDTSCGKNKFKIICTNFIIVNVCTLIKCLFEHMLCLCITYEYVVKDKENWVLIFKNIARRGLLSFESNGKNILEPREGKG